MRALLRPLLLMSLACAGCGPAVDLTKGVQLLDISTGWLDVGIVNGQNKLVPSITFKVKNVSDQKLIALKVNAMFRRVNNPEDWGSGFVIVAQSEGLEPGATSKAFTIPSTLGYTGLEPRADMLKHALFVDAKVELSARYGSVQWTRVGDYPIERRLITE
jgi:hypothetical protein